MSKKAFKLHHTLNEIRTEFLRASNLHGQFNSQHEGYGVLKEEVDELWDAIKANDHKGARLEAVQVAAMALRFLIDLEGFA